MWIKISHGGNFVPKNWDCVSLGVKLESGYLYYGIQFLLERYRLEVSRGRVFRLCREVVVWWCDSFKITIFRQQYSSTQFHSWSGQCLPVSSHTPTTLSRQAGQSAPLVLVPRTIHLFPRCSWEVGYLNWQKMQIPPQAEECEQQQQADSLRTLPEYQWSSKLETTDDRAFKMEIEAMPCMRSI